MNRIERKFDWLAMPGLIRYLAMLGGLVYALAWLTHDFSVHLNFDKTAIREKHEYWRLVTFPFAISGLRPSLGGIIFLVFAIQFSFTISDGLERIWGATRTTLFVLICWISMIFCGFYLKIAPDYGVLRSSNLCLIFSSTLLAFASHYPHHRIFFMMILPVPIWLIAAFMLIGLGMTVLTDPSFTPTLLLTHSNLLIWVLPHILKERSQLIKAGHKRRQFKASSLPADDAFHHCAVCNRTEHDDAHLEFRVHSDGKEYCAQHVPQK